MTRFIQGSKPKNLRSHNIKAILSLLWQEKALTIRDISHRISLSSTTTNKILSHLINEGVIVSVGKGASTSEGGKCPERFSLNGSHCYFIVCSLSFPFSKLVLLDLTARVVDEVELYADSIENYEYLQTIQNIAIKIDRLLIKNHIGPEQAFRIILSVAGITNPVEGIIHDAFVPTWGKNLPICNDLEAELPYKIPVYLDHVNVFIGYAESLKQSAIRNSYWILLKDNGVCVFDEMQPVRGLLGYIGSFNMLIIDASRTDISQKNPGGNFTSLVNQEALLGEAIQLSQQYPDSCLFQKIQSSSLKPADIFSAADRGDQLAVKIMDIMAEWFYIVCHNLIVLYNPQKIVIQGMYREAGQYFLQKLRKLGSNLPSYEPDPPYEICYSNLDEKTVEAAGAVLFVFHHFFIESF